MPVFKRKIFYLSGYDPRGARFYQQLYTEQAALYAKRSGHDIRVGDRKKAGDGNSFWTIEDHTSGAMSELTFLGWDDVIRRHWIRNPVRLLWGAMASTLAFTKAMDWRHGRTFPYSSLLAFYYPVLSTVALPIILLALIWLLGGSLLALAAGLAFSLFIAHRIKSLWMLRFIIFNNRLAKNTPDPDIKMRLDKMTTTIDAALLEPWDEILFVTHSNGSILAVPIMARLLAMHEGQMPDNFALMSLGSCIPLVGCRRDSQHYRDQLENVALGEFLWLDIGSRTDGACLPLVDPCISCLTEHRPTLHILSPRWFKYCDPATYNRRRRNKYETHFEYLRSFDRVSPLDYLHVTSCADVLPKSIAAFIENRA
ncbi:MAG: hypothetical protein JJE34_02415 [Alphaproteobacteria bacterium]|nr:hypothetical protein [Alphaproteobacteria bacterium]